MNVVIDERETELYQCCLPLIFENTNVRLTKQVLHLGDISIQTDNGTELLLIERKSIRDLIASIRDGRYDEQSHRLLNASNLPPHNIIYMIEGSTGNSETNPKERKQVLSAITSLNYYKGFSVFRTITVRDTAQLIVSMADKIYRNTQKGIFPYKPIMNPVSLIEQEPEEEYPQNVVIENETDTLEQPPLGGGATTANHYCNFVKKVKRDNITPDNIGEILLCQIPGISSMSAIAIMKQFPTFIHLLEELKTRPTCLDTIYIESNGKKRKINKSIIENIKKYLLPPKGTVGYTVEN